MVQIGHRVPRRADLAALKKGNAPCTSRESNSGHYTDRVVPDQNLPDICVFGAARKLKIMYTVSVGARGSLVVKTLRHKPEGRGFETR
jgi:hypothetical protein